MSKSFELVLSDIRRDRLEKTTLCSDFPKISVIFPNTATIRLHRMQYISTLKRP